MLFRTNLHFTLETLSTETGVLRSTESNAASTNENYHFPFQFLTPQCSLPVNLDETLLQYRDE